MDKEKARQIAYKNISVDNKECNRCSKTGGLQRHHNNYNNPLDIEVVCRACHSIIHRNDGEEVIYTEEDKISLKNTVELRMKNFPRKYHKMLVINAYDENKKTKDILVDILEKHYKGKNLK